MEEGAFVLVQREMESERSPLASIAPLSAAWLGRHRPKYSGSWRTGQGS